MEKMVDFGFKTAMAYTISKVIVLFFLCQHRQACSLTSFGLRIGFFERLSNVMGIKGWHFD
jgi:hypothetical protein